MTELTDYRARGARALVLLHERQLRIFLATWRRAAAWGVALPATDNPNYASLEALLRHVFRAAGGYLRWIAKQLERPDPGVDPVPDVDAIGAEADAYLEHLLERWRAALAGVAPERLEDRSYVNDWGTPYTIDGMLEHAVVHPIRHAFQLEELIDG